MPVSVPEGVGVNSVVDEPPQAVNEATSAKLAAPRAKFLIFKVIKLNRLLLA